MQFTAKHFDNVYLLTDEQPHLTNDLVVYVSPEDKTVVIDHQALNHEVIGERTKVLWCYEPGKKLAGKTTYIYMPYVMSVAPQTIVQDLIPVQPMMSRYSEIEVNEDFYLPINGYATIIKN